MLMLTIYPQTNRLFRPLRGQLCNFTGAPIAWTLLKKTEKISKEIKHLLSLKDRPSTTSLRSYYKDDYQVGLYDQLGSGGSYRSLRTDLLFFLSEQNKAPWDHLSLWAVFEDDDFLENEFDDALWRELSFLNSGTNESTNSQITVTSDPLENGFHFTFAGAKFFVYGLCATNSRHSRRFPYPTLVFTVFNQHQAHQISRAESYNV